MSRHFQPVDPAQLPDRLADVLAAGPASHPLRVALDGPPCAEPHALADSIVAPLRARGRPVIRVDARTFWRDASLRLEHGRTDAESYATSWLDAGALAREVLDPLAAAGSGEYLPSLRDPASNRATRAARLVAPQRAVLIVSGSLLLRHGLPFDVSIHLALGAPARRRRTPAEDAWTLPAFDRYDDEVAPAVAADVVVRLDDPRHPAISAALPHPSP